MRRLRRRDVLAGTAVMLMDAELSRGAVIAHHLPWKPDTESTPKRAKPGSWEFFTAAEAAVVAAFADRIIPPDPQTPGGKEAGCAVFIDRQLAGPYGRYAGLYEKGPFHPGAKQQGPQSAQTPAQLYRQALAALAKHCHAHPEQCGGGKPLASLDPQQQDAILTGLEDGSLELEGVESKTFFEQLLQDVQQGFFADPIYGGNRDMCAWKMIGFPGARYDYRDWVSRHNERYPHPPVSIGGSIDWTPRRR